jgi:hypothetical protein
MFLLRSSEIKIYPMKKLLFFFAIIFSTFSKGQTINAGSMLQQYTDINPDILVTYTIVPYTNNSYSFNICGDAANDIVFQGIGSTSPGGTSAYIRIMSLNANMSVRFGRWDSVYIPAYSYWDVSKVAKPLNNGEPVNPINAMWDDSVLYLTDHSGWGNGNMNVNDWIGGDKFLGIKFQNGANTEYGWIRVQCPSKDSCYVKDYSMTQTITFLSENKMNRVAAFPNPCATEFFIQKSGLDLQPATILITDLFGTAVRFTATDGSDGIRISFAENVPDGCYLLSYKSNDRFLYNTILKSEK